MPARSTPHSLSHLLNLQPCRATWVRLRKHLDTLHGAELDAACAQAAPVLRAWDPLLSRPPLNTWKGADPRLRLCRIVNETATYNDYILAFAKILTRSGKQAVQLERQVTGMAYSVDGNMMQVGVTGAGDLKGGVILEWVSGGKLRSVGARLEVEVKAEKGKTRDGQNTRHIALTQRGECHVVAYSIDEAVAQVRAWKENKEKELEQ